MMGSLYFHISSFLFPNMHSVQRNFMASKSFKVGFSMNIKMMLFPQFVRCFILTFLFCQPFVCSFISDILQCQILSLLLQNCKVKHSRIVSSFFVLLSFSSESFQRQTQPNSVPLLPKNQEKKREEILIGCF